MFINLINKIITNISGAEAPDEIPIVEQLAKSFNTILLSEWINRNLGTPIALLLNFFELDTYFQLQKRITF